MPKELHDKLARLAKKRGLTGERRDAYVYGTMNRLKKTTNREIKQAARKRLLRGK